MTATITLQNINSYSGYFNVNIKINNTGNSSLVGVRLRPVYIIMPDASVVVDPQFGNPPSPSYDPLVLASWTLPTIPANSTYVQTSLLPVLSSLYQGPYAHTCQFLVVQEGVAILSNTLNVVITPITDDYFCDTTISSFHNNTEVLNYQATGVSNTTYVDAYTSTLDSVNLGASATVQMASTNSSDTQMYRIVGLDMNSNVLVERGLLTGTTIVNSRSKFSHLYDFYLSSPAIGTVTVNQSSLTYVVVPTTFNRPSGFRFADSRPRLMHFIETGDSPAIYIKVTAQGFGSGLPEIPLFEKYFSGPVYLYPPIYVPPNSVVRGYMKTDGVQPANIYGVLSTAPVYGF